jgi:hypothetical protein
MGLFMLRLECNNTVFYCIQLALISNTKPKKVGRPKVGMAITTADWNYFTQHWAGYRMACNLTGNDIPQQLVECCDEMLCHDLYRHMGSAPNGKTEEDLLMA